MPEEETWQVLKDARACRLAFLARSRPCIVPLSHVVIGQKIYFHSASAGEKVEAIGDGAEVCVEVDEILGRMLDCEGYRSVVARGWCRPVGDTTTKRTVLDAVKAKYNPEYRDTPQSVAKVIVFEIEVREITGKVKR